MKDAWILVIGGAVVAVVSLAVGVYLRSVEQVGVIGARWNQAAAVIIASAIVIAADSLERLDWYFAIPLGSLAYGVIRLPAYVRHSRSASSDQSRKENSN